MATMVAPKAMVSVDTGQLIERQPSSTLKLLQDNKKGAVLSCVSILIMVITLSALLTRPQFLPAGPKEVGPTGHVPKPNQPLSSLTPYPAKKWTVAVYQNADNNLEPMIYGCDDDTGDCDDDDDEGDVAPPDDGGGERRRRKRARTPLGFRRLESRPGDFHDELAKGGSNADVNVVALLDRSPLYSERGDNWNGTRLYYIEEGDFADNSKGTYWVNETNRELNMGDPNTLKFFLNLLKEKFPSDHIFLSMWDHNWAWHNGWFESDETSNSTIDYDALGDMLAGMSAQDGAQMVDIVSYDACVGATIEVAHTWKTMANFFVGSQDYVGWYGVHYDTVINAITSNPEISPVDLSRIIAASMIDDEEDTCATSVAISVAGLPSSSFDVLVEAVNDLADALLLHWEDGGVGGGPDFRERVGNVRQCTPQVPTADPKEDDEESRDLKAMALCFADEFADYDDVVEKSQQIINMLDLSIEFFAFNEATGPSTCVGGTGLNIYWSAAGEGPDSDYERTTFGRKASSWVKVLKKF